MKVMKKWNHPSILKCYHFIIYSFCRVPTEETSESTNLIQQQLLLLNSLSNRLTWLFNDLSNHGVSNQMYRPHETALNRMLNASRELQLKLQKNLRKSPPTESSFNNHDQLETLEKEKKRLEEQLSVVSDKLTFFSNEYQRVTELYLTEKNKNNQTVNV